VSGIFLGLFARFGATKCVNLRPVESDFGLLIRVSLVRVQVGEPDTARARSDAGLFVFWLGLGFEEMFPAFMSGILAIFRMVCCDPNLG